LRSHRRWPGVHAEIGPRVRWMLTIELGEVDRIGKRSITNPRWVVSAVKRVKQAVPTTNDHALFTIQSIGKTDAWSKVVLIRRQYATTIITSYDDLAILCKVITEPAAAFAR